MAVTLNIGQPTRIPSENQTERGRLELTLGSPNIATQAEWWVDMSIASHHCGVFTTLTFNKVPQTHQEMPMHWRYSKADWPVFAKVLDETLQDVPQELDVNER